LDLIGLVDKIAKAVVNIDTRRKGWAVQGKEQKSRIPFEEGIAKASSAFEEAKGTADLQVLLLAEYTFICQELQLCNEKDLDSKSSLSQAKQNFDNAFLALQIVEDSTLYKGAEKLTFTIVNIVLMDYQKMLFILLVSHTKPDFKTYFEFPVLIQ